MNNWRRGFIGPLLIVIIAVLLVAGAAYVYSTKKTETPQTLPAAAQNTTHYSNQFYSFDYPADFSIATSSVYNSHEKASNGLYLYGMSVIRFQTDEPVYFINASVISVNWLNHAPVAPEQGIASAKEDFDSNHEIPTDSFQEIDAGGLIGYRVTYSTIFPDRDGSLEVRLFSKSYSYDLKFDWTRNGNQWTSASEEMAQKLAEHFADVFIKSFTVNQQ